ncbi:MAG: HAMP domain-containing histidine kinase, partial [Chitinophagaceae bacterium]
NETKNKLFSIVAHDLRSPLGSIQNYLELINEHELSPEEKNMMEQELLSKTKDTGQMLFNILNWSMNQMGGVSVTMEPLDINEALKPVLNLQNTLAREKGIELKNEIQADAIVNCDLNMLQLVVRNIVSNAIKFTPPGGLIKISSTPADDKLQIIVEDSGVGISDTQKENLFSLKTQPSYGTGNEKGLGLGLVLCKEFIGLQGGEICFESEPGKGTTVYITLCSPQPAQLESGIVEPSLKDA